ncbi:MAG TPA: zinc-binding dehydrogenase [Candidatus Binataceae bacterium]|nr:zinc-binding dehydrogenase [Candidatus Binataceae bacterium]
MSQTMKALYNVPGPEGAIPQWREVPIPTPGVGEVLVRIHASAINRGELIRRPELRLDNPNAKPGRGGTEFGGEIAAVGAGVSQWKVGDRVMARAHGCYAPFTVVDQRALMAIPAGLSWVAAAAIPNVFITAHDALVSNARLAAGEAVMITAGSSGVGTAAIQIARCLEAHPVLATTRSAAKSEALRSLGADQVINTTEPGWTEAVLKATGGRGVDVIIDHVGGSMLPDNIKALAIKGRLVSVGRNDSKVGPCDLDEVARKRISIIGVTFRTRSAEEALQCSQRFAEQMLGEFERGRMHPVVDRTFAFEQINDAHAYMLGNAQVGKIVLTMD